MLRYCGARRGEPRPGVSLDNPRRRLPQQRRVQLEQLLLEVTQDQPYLGMGGAAGQPDRVDEALPARGVAGVKRSSGSSATICAASRRALTSAARLPWMDVETVDPDDRLKRREGLVLQLAEPGTVERVGAAGAEPLDVEPDAPSPISSSGVKAIRIAGRGNSGLAARWATAVMIAATPALSSAPSSVSPLAVTMSCPIALPARASTRDRVGCPPAAARSRPRHSPGGRAAARPHRARRGWCRDGRSPQPSAYCSTVAGSVAKT